MAVTARSLRPCRLWHTYARPLPNLRFAVRVDEKDDCFEDALRLRCFVVVVVVVVVVVAVAVAAPAPAAPLPSS